MPLHPELFITNVGFIASAAVTIALGLFVFIRGSNRHLRITFFLFCISSSVFMISHVAGINAGDPFLARRFFLFNANNIFLVALNAHWVIVLLGRLKREWIRLVIIYVLGIALFTFFMINPDSFMLEPKPYRYLPLYYVAGPLYGVMTTYFLAVFAYFMYHMWSAFRGGDFMIRRKIGYVMIGYGFAYVVGLTAAAPLFGINIDPILSVLVGLHALPQAYAIVQYEVLAVSVVAKRGLLYGLTIAAVSILLISVSAGNEYISRNIPGFSPYVIPLVSSLLAVGIGSMVRRKIRDVDSLKYEFVTVMMHKFRTPLTAIKWSAENLHGVDLSDRGRENVDAIKDSASKIEALTDTLLMASELEHDSAQGLLAPIQIKAVIDEIMVHEEMLFKKKGVELMREEKEVPILVLDHQKIRFALSLLIDNALTFTPPGGKVHVRVFRSWRRVVVEVTDSGAGILPSDIPRVFQRFYRSEAAKRLNPDGLGVSLSLVRSIVNQNGGSISVSSAGEDAGSVFTVRLPITGVRVVSPNQ